MPSLRDLDAKFLRYEERVETYTIVNHQPELGETNADVGTHEITGPRAYFPFVEMINEAQGVEFVCPKCAGTLVEHRVICWSSSRGVPDHAEPKPGRWRLVGTSIEDLTLEAEPGMSRSVQVIGGCAWHGFVTNGVAE